MQSTLGDITILIGKYEMILSRVAQRTLALRELRIVLLLLLLLLVVLVLVLLLLLLLLLVKTKPFWG